MTSRDLQKRQTRQAFFQSVLQLSRSGHAFSSISLRQISREVGVVPTAFYRHFQDIDELGTCLVNEELGHTLQNLRDHLQLGRTRTHKVKLPQACVSFWKVWSMRHCTGTLLSLNAMVVTKLCKMHSMSKSACLRKS